MLVRARSDITPFSERNIFIMVRIGILFLKMYAIYRTVKLLNLISAKENNFIGHWVHQ